MRTIARCFLLFGLVAAVPRVAAAQAILAGEVKDTTGAVLPGVTVEAASPALIEKVRTAVTDGSGRYRIESLPPGSYTLTFSLTGFVPMKREDIIVSGSGVIPVDVALTVAAAETITVTPRRRDEPLLDVPGAINAFTAADIKAAGIDRPQDFVALTPNMSLVQTQNQGTSFVTVRGISQARNSEPSVAVLIDGVQMANPSQFNQELFDIDTIEVVKGPQGAVYGRNAIGGAIIINTKKPSDVFEGNVTLGSDSGPGINVRGSIGGPISNTLKYIASGSFFGSASSPLLCPVSAGLTWAGPAGRTIVPLSSIQTLFGTLTMPSSSSTRCLGSTSEGCSGAAASTNGRACSGSTSSATVTTSRPRGWSSRRSSCHTGRS